MTTEVEVIPVSKMTTAMTKANITDQILGGLKVHMALVVKDPTDLEGYEVVKKALKECADLRILATKIAEDGRADAIAEQRAWLAEEKRVVGQITPIEAHLKKQKAIVDDEQKRKEEEAHKIFQARIVARGSALAKVGVFLLPEVLAVMPDSEYDALLKSSTEKFEVEQKKKAEEDEKRKADQKILDDQRAEQIREAARLKEITDGIIKARLKKLEEFGAEFDFTVKELAEMTEEVFEAHLDLCKKKKEVADSAEKACIEAMKPDKEKLAQFAKEIGAIRTPVLDTETARQILAKAAVMITNAMELLTR